MCEREVGKEGEKQRNSERPRETQEEGGRHSGLSGALGTEMNTGNGH